MTDQQRSGKPVRLTLGIIIIAGALAAGWILWSSPAATGADGNEAQKVAEGAIVYRDHCASCHGANLEGQPNWKSRTAEGRLPAPPHDETGHTWHHADDALFALIKHGLTPPLAPAGYQSDMPAFGAVLSD